MYGGVIAYGKQGNEAGFSGGPGPRPPVDLRTGLGDAADLQRGVTALGRGRDVDARERVVMHLTRCLLATAAAVTAALATTLSAAPPTAAASTPCTSIWQAVQKMAVRRPA